MNEIPCAEDIHMIEVSATNGDCVEEISEIIEDIEQESLAEAADTGDSL